MHSFLLGFFLFSLGTNLGFAQDEVVSFKNVREGKSYYLKSSHTQAAGKALKVLPKEEILRLYNEALEKQDRKTICAFNLTSEISKTLKERSLKIDLGGLVYVLRAENEIDDVVAKILLTAIKVKATTLPVLDAQRAAFPDTSAETKSQLELVTSFEKRFAKTACFDDAYRTYYGEILKISKKTKSYELGTLHLRALEAKRITLEIYTALEQARINELETTTLSLATYQQKLKTLRLQYPLRDESERSDFTSVEVKKMKSSRRQKIFENYTDLQIIMMGNVIKKLRSRLEYDLVEISGFKNGVLQETIPLDPMERFRFAIKALRKEMSLLSLNSYFSGRTPDYMDLMVASYEIGIIPASELETVASLEEIWNPKKTFWDKAGIWVKMFSSVATLVIPPPYGFIPALVIVVIEATVGKKDDPNQNDQSVLF